MSSGFVLKDGTIVNHDRWIRADVRVRGSRIHEIASGIKAGRGETVIDCSDSFIYPGLINSHEHLEFNLYSRLGEPPYRNAYEWGNDLHRRWKANITEIQKVPLRHRLWWGAWKNLFSGVTRVVHHNPYHAHFRLAYPVDVLRRYTFAHSLRFDPNLSIALSRRRPATPFIIHLAEGRDDESLREVSALDGLGGIDERTVAVHAVNVSEKDIELLKLRRASVVWCPSSNSFLFGGTAPIHLLYGRVPVALGTDSSLTGSVCLFDELRTAQRASSLPSNKLFEMVTSAPRSIFNLPFDAGRLVEKGRADLFTVSANNTDPYGRLIGCLPGDIRLLMSRGRILMSERPIAAHFPLCLNGKEKFIRSKTFPKLFRFLSRYLSHYSYLPNADF